MPSPINGSTPAASPASSTLAPAKVCCGAYHRIGNALYPPWPLAGIGSLRKSRGQRVEQPRLGPPVVNRVARALIVDADVQMGPACDQTRKRPRITADSGGHAGEIEAVRRIVDISRARGFNRDVEHQGAPDPFPAAAKKSVAHPAARAVRADQHLGLEVAAAAVNPHSGGVAFAPRAPGSPRRSAVRLRAPRGPGARRTHRGGRSCTGLRRRGSQRRRLRCAPVRAARRPPARRATAPILRAPASSWESTRRRRPWAADGAHAPTPPPRPPVPGAGAAGTAPLPAPQGPPRLSAPGKIAASP